MNHQPYISDGLEVKCAQCGELYRWHTTGKGKAKKSTTVCGCAPPEPEGRRKVSPKGRKNKGSNEERAIVKWAEECGWTAYRTAGSGAHGSRNNEADFATDVRLKLGDIVFKVESKRHAKVAGLKSLLNLRDSSDWLWVREDFAEAFVLIPASQLSAVMALAAEAKK